MQFHALASIWAAAFFFTDTQALPTNDMWTRNEITYGNDVFSCLVAQDVPYSTANSQNWANLSSAYNTRLQYQPAVITIPRTPREVQASVICAAQYNLKVQPKGGGHSYASYSSGGQNGSLIVQMENFDEISVNQETFVAKIGTGQRLGNIAQALYDQGKRALPHGTCSGVGIAGHSLHGGYGFSSRLWGLTIDRIVGMDVVLANGTEIHANETSYPLIYYAMRGAGDSFGIATSLYLQTEPAPKAVLWFTANLSSSLKDINTVTSGFEQLQNTSLHSSLVTPSLAFGLYVDSGGSFSIRGWCIECDIDNFCLTIFPALLSGFNYSDASVTSQDWIPALANLASPNALSQPLGSSYQEHDNFYAKSLVVSNTQPMTPSSIRAFFLDVIAQQNNLTWYILINLYGGPNSAINQVATNASAYSDRDALWVFQNYGHLSIKEPWNPALKALVKGFNDAVINAQPDVTFTAYMNYADPDLSMQEASMQFYGRETYERLVAIKLAADPRSVFWNPQSISTQSVFLGNAIT